MLDHAGYYQNKFKFKQNLCKDFSWHNILYCHIQIKLHPQVCRRHNHLAPHYQYNETRQAASWCGTGTAIARNRAERCRQHIMGCSILFSINDIHHNWCPRKASIIISCTCLFLYTQFTHLVPLLLSCSSKNTVYNCLKIHWSDHSNHSVR